MLVLKLFAMLFQSRKGLSSLAKLAHLFNGNLILTHRIEQLDKWLIFFRSKFIAIDNLNLNSSSRGKVVLSLKDGWLSGFTDAEGCFNISITERSANTLGYRTKLRFILDQNDKFLLETIRDLLKTGLVYKRSKNLPIQAPNILPSVRESASSTASLPDQGLDHFRFTAESLIGFPVIVSYFEMFPLKTFKKEAFQKWLIIYTMMVNKEHLTQEGLDKIRILAKSVNDKSSLND